MPAVQLDVIIIPTHSPADAWLMTQELKAALVQTIPSFYIQQSRAPIFCLLSFSLSHQPIVVLASCSIGVSRLFSSTQVFQSEKCFFFNAKQLAAV